MGTIMTYLVWSKPLEQETLDQILNAKFWSVSDVDGHFHDHSHEGCHSKKPKQSNQL